MKKIIFGIFAHPDDESFGPSGTLLRETSAGNEVHLITFTTGQGGSNPDHYEDLGQVRKKEWHAAGALIGASSMHDLGYEDGTLNNLTMIESAKKITSIIKNTIPDNFNGEIEFMSMDTNGITGHIDHIVAARAACLVFFRLKEHDPRVTRIRLACIDRLRAPLKNTHWLYMEAGRTDEEISETVDNRDNIDEIIKIMQCHQTQRSDLAYHLENRSSTIGLDTFIVLE